MEAITNVYTVYYCPIPRKENYLAVTSEWNERRDRKKFTVLVWFAECLSLEPEVEKKLYMYTHYIYTCIGNKTTVHSDSLCW